MSPGHDHLTERNPSEDSAPSSQHAVGIPFRTALDARIQPPLQVSGSNDPNKQGTDRAATQIVPMPAQSAPLAEARPVIRDAVSFYKRATGRSFDPQLLKILWEVEGSDDLEVTATQIVDLAGVGNELALFNAAQANPTGLYEKFVMIRLMGIFNFGQDAIFGENPASLSGYRAKWTEKLVLEGGQNWTTEHLDALLDLLLAVQPTFEGSTMVLSNEADAVPYLVCTAMTWDHRFGQFKSMREDAVERTGVEPVEKGGPKDLVGYLGFWQGMPRGFYKYEAVEFLRDYSRGIVDSEAAGDFSVLLGIFQNWNERWDGEFGGSDFEDALNKVVNDRYIGDGQGARNKLVSVVATQSWNDEETPAQLDEKDRTDLEDLQDRWGDFAATCYKYQDMLTEQFLYYMTGIDDYPQLLSYHEDAAGSFGAGIRNFVNRYKEATKRFPWE